VKPKKRGSQSKKSGLTLDPKDLQGRLRFMGGSASDHWNNILVNQATSSLWVAHSEEEEQDRQRSATVVALIGIRPKDELEAMMAAQLLAAHNATMECYRRAMLPEQTSEGRSQNLNQANKLSRTYAVLLEALNRHRGKGQQKVTVEHVHVHSGGLSALRCRPRQSSHGPQQVGNLTPICGCVCGVVSMLEGILVTLGSARRFSSV